MLSLIRRVVPRGFVLPTMEWPRARARVDERADGTAMRNLAAGGLCAIVAVAFAGAFGQLVFGGALSPYLGYGVRTALISTIVMLLVLPMRGAFRFSVGGPDANPSAVLAVSLSGMAGAIAAPEEMLPTVVAFVAISAVTCGGLVWVVGASAGGRCVRYIPYPVVAGFLAGSGYLLVAGAFRSVTGETLSFGALTRAWAAGPMAGVTAIVVAAALFAGVKYVRHYLVIPGVIVGAILAFHAVRAGVGIDVETARTQGLLLPIPAAMSWESFRALDFSLTRWDLLWTRVTEIAAMTAVVVVTALMNTTSIEVATGRDGNADRELRAIGVGNLLAGALGGMVASNSFNRTLLNVKAGATSAWATRLAAGVIVVALFAAPGTMGFLPRPVLAGLILYLGVSLLTAWAIESRRTMGTIDYAVVLVILGVVMAVGIVPGVVVGIFIACASFAVAMSRGRNVRHAFTAQTHRSNVERTADEIATLRAEGDALRGFVLDGVLFFGTAARLLEEIRGSLERTKVVLLDFRLVQGIDGSAIVVLKRVHSLCRELGTELVLTGVSNWIEARMARGGFDFGAQHVHRFADLDRGLEWCEERILGRRETPAGLVAQTWGGALTSEEGALLEKCCERRRLVPGELLIRQGNASDAMYFIERGRVHVMLPPETPGEGSMKRLRTYGAGSIVGEMGFYTGEARSADIVVEEETEALCLTRERLSTLEVSDPALAHALQRVVIQNLAQRLRAANEEIRELL